VCANSPPEEKAFTEDTDKATIPLVMTAQGVPLAMLRDCPEWIKQIKKSRKNCLPAPESRGDDSEVPSDHYESLSTHHNKGSPNRRRSREASKMARKRDIGDSDVMEPSRKSRHVAVPFSSDSEPDYQHKTKFDTYVWNKKTAMRHHTSKKRARQSDSEELRTKRITNKRHEQREAHDPRVDRRKEKEKHRVEDRGHGSNARAAGKVKEKLRSDRQKTPSCPAADYCL
jgi:hypothetical protein